MSGNPENASIWADADVYVAPVGSAVPADITTPFAAAWSLVGLLDGEAGFEESRSRDSTDHMAWGGILVATSRRNFVLTKKFVALEDNLVVAGLVWPGSGPDEQVVPDPTYKFLIAFETTDGAKKRRVISERYAQVEEVGTIKDSEAELTKYEITVKIYPTAGGVLNSVQPPLEVTP